MRPWISSLAIAASLALTAPAALAAPPAAVVPASAPDAALAARIDKAVDAAIAEHRLVGAVVLVARDGKVVYRRAAGLADREAGRPMTQDAVFRFSSVTKPFVSVAAMRLVQDGVIGLDDPVTKYLPDFRPKLADGTEPVITVGQLLDHTAGLTYGLSVGPEHPYHKLGVSDGMDLSRITLDENLRRLGQAPLEYAPGSAWRYSLAIDVIGGVLEKATGKTLQQVVAETVTDPLGLTDTGFSTDQRARLATPYYSAPGGPKPMTDNMELPAGPTNAIRFAPSRALDKTAFPSGGAGMVGTASDVLTLLETLRQGGGPILKSQTVATMMKDQAGAQARSQGPGWGFGYGWAVLDDPAAAKTPQGVGTIQWGGVYGHSWFVDPVNHLTVVAMTNTTFEGMNGAFVTQLRDAVYGR